MLGLGKYLQGGVPGITPGRGPGTKHAHHTQERDLWNGYPPIPEQMTDTFENITFPNFGGR